MTRKTPPDTPLLSVSQRHEQGLSDHEYRDPGLHQVTRGWYVGTEALAEPRPQLRLCHELLATLPPDAALSHASAAAWLDLPAPDSSTVHVTLHPRSVLPRRPDLTMHGRDLPASDVDCQRGLRVTTAERTYLDLAGQVRLHQLVAVGDAALRLGYATAQSLAGRVARAGHRRGVVLARTALPLLDGRAQSAPESFARVWIGRSILPTPALQLPVRGRSGELIGHADLGYDEFRLALEYEGAHHAQSGQFEYDVGRYTAMAAAGWSVLRFTRADLRAAGAPLLTTVHRALVQRGWRPPQPRREGSGHQKSAGNLVSRP